MTIENLSQNIPQSARGEEIFISWAVLFAALKNQHPALESSPDRLAEAVMSIIHFKLH